MTTDPVRVVLVDDHEVIRFGLRKLLEGVDGVAVVGEAGERDMALAQVDQNEPDVLIVGIASEDSSGLDLARHVATHHTKTRVMIFSAFDDEHRVLEALQGGVAAYVLKTADIEEVLTALRSVTRGYRYVSPPLLGRALQVYSDHAIPPVPTALHMLTKREREIITLASDGLTNSDIGARLHISPRTAEGHRSSAMRKLGLRNQGDLARFFAGLQATDDSNEQRFGSAS